jgi:hypothetical protein
MAKHDCNLLVNHKEHKDERFPLNAFVVTHIELFDVDPPILENLYDHYILDLVWCVMLLLTNKVTIK